MTMPTATTMQAALIQAMLAESSIAELVQNRIHGGGRSPSGSQGHKRIVVRTISSPRFMTMNGPSGLANPRFEINCYAPGSHVDALAIAEAVRLFLDGFRGDMAGFAVGSIQIEDISDLEPSTGPGDPDVGGGGAGGDFGVSIDALIMHQETVNTARIITE